MGFRGAAMFGAQVSKGTSLWLARAVGDERYERLVEERGEHLAHALPSCHPRHQLHNIGVWAHCLGCQPCAS